MISYFVTTPFFHAPLHRVLHASHRNELIQLPISSNFLLVAKCVDRV